MRFIFPHHPAQVITEDFAGEIRRALIIGPGETPPEQFVRDEGWNALLLHRRQRRAGLQLCARTTTGTPPDAA